MYIEKIINMESKHLFDQKTGIIMYALLELRLKSRKKCTHDLPRKFRK